MRWIQEFSDGSRDQRELLGGKGAGVAEMTRVLGAERVPPIGSRYDARLSSSELLHVAQSRSSALHEKR
jgi:hypothetical protein